MTPASAADDDDDDGAASASLSVQRLDKWLWYTRVVKSRTLAAGLVTGGHVRINRERVVKPSQSVRMGDVVTVTVGPRVRILEVVAPGARRGPPTEAQQLYRDLTPPRERVEKTPLVAPRAAGSGRPTKRDRRALDRLLPDED